MQFYWQHYSEPAAETTTTALSNDTVLPLGPGTLTHNAAGVPIIVTCTKADLIDENDDVGGGGMTGMVKGKTGMQEDRTDEIMQVLRTICLKCAACFACTTKEGLLTCSKRRRSLILYDYHTVNIAIA